MHSYSSLSHVGGIRTSELRELHFGLQLSNDRFLQPFCIVDRSLNTIHALLALHV